MSSLLILQDIRSGLGMQDWFFSRILIEGADEYELPPYALPMARYLHSSGVPGWNLTIIFRILACAKIVLETNKNVPFQGNEKSRPNHALSTGRSRFGRLKRC
jgi:hypothetical protein